MGRLFVFSWIFLFTIIESFAQRAPSSFYVVVGVFAVKSNAERYTSRVEKLNYSSAFALNPQKNLYYVYSLHTEDRSEALSLVYRMRKEPEFAKTWIYTGYLEGHEPPAADAIAGNDGEVIKEDSAPAEVTAAGPSRETVNADSAAVEGAGSSTAQTAEETESAKPLGKPFVFNLINASTSEPVRGQVVIVESEADTIFQSFNGNEQVYIRPPKNSAGKMVIICHMIGYKLFKKAINFNTIKDADNEEGITIPIKLVAAKKGDYIELQQVNFYENSAILKPESEKELQELVNFMSNPRYKVEIQAHTHDNKGKTEIITLGESTDLFALNGANKYEYGTMKELTKHRAEIIKKYLVSKGIASNRVSVKGFGGAVAIYEHSHANDRIEVEILKD